jgi:hypothetical protein
MSAIVDRITIHCAPEKVYDLLVSFFQSPENYRTWHPDHITCYWKKGKDFSPGSVLIAEEYIHGARHRLGFRITNNIPGRLLEYKMLFPFSVICRGGFFKLMESESSTELVAGLDFRGGFLLKGLLRNRVNALKRHM